MAEHEVQIEIIGKLKVPPKTRKHSNITFWIWADDKRLGQLRIGKGGLEWHRSHTSKDIWKKSRWEEFADWMKTKK